MEPPPSVLGYSRELTGRLASACGGLLRAAYLHGSAVLGGWAPGRSDVDMLFVTAGSPGSAAVQRISQALCEAADRCPGRELECSTVTVAQAGQPAPPWPYVLHVAAGPGRPEPAIYLGSRSPGDRDLLMHYAVCRYAGWPVHGPPATEVIGEVARPVILGYLADELGWGLEHGTEAYAVLNACRALIYLTDHRIVSKIAGGETMLRHGTGPPEVIRRALDQQQGSQPDRAPASDAVRFVRAAATTLRSA